LLQALPNVDFVEMDDASTCCGLGGTFSVHHYKESRAIGAKKIPGLRESRASMIATTCPGCIMQLQDSINHAGMKVRAVHLLELLVAALGPR
jgi:glycolate oxidase iron-sulfur subunit